MQIQYCFANLVSGKHIFFIVISPCFAGFSGRMKLLYNFYLNFSLVFAKGVQSAIKLLN